MSVITKKAACAIIAAQHRREYIPPELWAYIFTFVKVIPDRPPRKKRGPSPQKLLKMQQKDRARRNQEQRQKRTEYRQQRKRERLTESEPKA